MVMQTVRVKDTDNRVITISKSNITLDRGGFAYTIEPVQLVNGISATVVKWGAAVEGTAQSIIDDAEGIERTGKPMNKVGEAETFLHEDCAICLDCVCFTRRRLRNEVGNLLLALKEAQQAHELPLNRKFRPYLCQSDLRVCPLRCK
jgi:hypothetical protein